MSRITGNNRLVLIARTALLSAVAVVLAILESFLPDFPFILPGMKLGLSNISILVAIEVCPFAGVLYIALVKSLFTLVTRGASAFFMSFAGTILSTVIMYALAKIKKPSFGCVGIGVAGAFAHNMGQLIAAYFIVGDAVKVYFPIIALFALISGALTGLLFHFVLPAVTKAPIFN